MRGSIVTRRIAATFALSAALACGSKTPAPGTGGSGPAPIATADGEKRGFSREDAPLVVVLSIDGLMPGAYLEPDAHGLQVPTLRELANSGAYSRGVRTVFPSMTYPAHTSMVTGVEPGRHGIVANRSWDPLNKNQRGWYWYAEDIAVPALWNVAGDALLDVALITWPVTVGADVNLRVPEFWRAGTADDVKLLDALSTPLLLDDVGKKYPGFVERFTPPNIRDEAIVDIALHVIDEVEPNLTLVHMWQVDDAEHKYGPWSPEVKQAIEHADQQIARIIQDCKYHEIWQNTVLVVVSDHGFRPLARWFRPGVVLAEMNLVTFANPGKDEELADWKAVFRALGGLAYIYVADEADEATKRAVRERFTRMAGAPGSGVARVYSRDEIRARGGDERAFLALGAADGFAFGNEYTGERVSESSDRGHHGYDPEFPEMNASLLIYGPRVTPGEIADARLIDLAPTIASWLGVSMPDVQGRVLPVEIRPPFPDEAGGEAGGAD